MRTYDHLDEQSWDGFDHAVDAAEQDDPDDRHTEELEGFRTSARLARDAGEVFPAKGGHLLRMLGHYERQPPAH
ncbi:MAG: hypothetical protein ACRDP1_16610 [Nocardioidaceae bacterium]